MYNSMGVVVDNFTRDVSNMNQIQKSLLILEMHLTARKYKMQIKIKED
jgi:hypothetical protein